MPLPIVTINQLMRGKKSWEDRILAIGHRGARGLAPENTLSSFQAALDIGVDGVELDVLKCASGEIVVFHDYDVDYISNGNGKIEHMTLDQIKELDVGTSFNSRFAGETMPTLGEVLDLLGDKILVNIELKGEDTRKDGLELDTLKEVNSRGLRNNVLISSFNPVRVWRIKNLDPEIRTGLLYQDDLALYLRKAWFAPFLRPFSMNPEFNMVTHRTVAKAHRRNRRVIPWIANSRVQIEHLIDIGVDGIISDRPDILLEVLNHS